VASHLITSVSSIGDADEVAAKVHGAVGRPMVSQVSNAATDVTSESPDTRPTQMRRDIETTMFLLPITAARDGRCNGKECLELATRFARADVRFVERIYA
jgi:hypothetical protein